MTDSFEKQTGNEDLWRTIFADGHPDLVEQHRVHSLLPKDPRCRLCLAPFAGIGGWYMRRKGKAPSGRNPHYCTACDGFLEAFPGGAEVEMSVLFVDIRNSTEYAAGAQPADVRRRVNLFLDRVTEAIAENDGFVMAFYGDCVVAVWPPGFSGGDHAAKALAAAQAIQSDATLKGENGAAIPFGIGLHSGPVFIGTVDAQKGMFRDVSIFGVNVVVTARLAAAAGPFELLVSDACIAAGASELDGTAEELALKGVDQAVTATRL